jgi:hypothetical protein
VAGAIGASRIVAFPDKSEAGDCILPAVKAALRAKTLIFPLYRNDAFSLENICGKRHIWRRNGTTSERRVDRSLRKDCVMRHAEPPSPGLCSEVPLFLVGRDRAGHWVARDTQGLRGGLFVDRSEALKFALFENGNRPQAVVTVPGILELDMSARPRAARQAPAAAPSVAAVAA